MKKIICFFAFITLISFSSTTFGQLLDEKNVTVVMDLQPVLQLNMTTPDHIDFVFNDIRQYYAGITKYGATVLKVSSTVSWDLWAVGTSQAATSFWDQEVFYGSTAATNASASLPMTALELHQTPTNVRTVAAGGSWKHYGTAFDMNTHIATHSTGRNSIYTNSSQPYERPAAIQKYIYGGLGVGTCGQGGSYLNQSTQVTTTDGSQFQGVDYFYFVIDYRIVPGLPAQFPYAGNNAGASHALGAQIYAQPGVYSMNVKYLLMEDN